MIISSWELLYEMQLEKSCSFANETAGIGRAHDEAWDKETKFHTVAIIYLAKGCL